MDEMNLFSGEEKSNLIHYEGVLGVFDYDPREFEVVVRVDASECLRYCGNGKSVDLPDGCINTRHMFVCCRFPDGFSLGKNFDTSKVTNMEGMFKECRLPEGFSLGEHFNTSNVTDMSGMFESCKLPGDFSLGEHFDTSNVAYMSRMFECCELSENFSLGEYFDTSNVISMKHMFFRCGLPEGFSLGEHFNTSNVIDMTSMFGNCKYNGIYVYDYFETQDAEEIIIKFRKYKKAEDAVVDNELTALMLSVSEELQISTSAVQRIMKSYLKSLINK